MLNWSLESEFEVLKSQFYGNFDEYYMFFMAFSKDLGLFDLKFLYNSPPPPKDLDPTPPKLGTHLWGGVPLQSIQIGGIALYWVEQTGSGWGGKNEKNGEKIYWIEVQDLGLRFNMWMSRSTILS